MCSLFNGGHLVGGHELADHVGPMARMSEYRCRNIFPLEGSTYGVLHSMHVAIVLSLRERFTESGILYTLFGRILLTRTPTE